MTAATDHQSKLSHNRENGMTIKVYWWV